MVVPLFFPEVSEEALGREKHKARELRQTQWWKNKRAPGLCHYCRSRFPVKELTMDHVVPLVRGGKSTKGNLVPCCRSCNASKKYLIPSEWEEHLQALAERKES